MPKSNKRIAKLCQHCDTAFVARTQSARFCKDKECHRSRMREYFREYYQRPVPKAKKSEQNKKYVVTEQMRQHKKDHRKRPEVTERLREQSRARYKNMTPEAKEKRLAYQRQYVAERKKKRKEVWEKIEDKAKENAPPVTRLTPEQYAQLKARGM